MALFSYCRFFSFIIMILEFISYAASLSDNCINKQNCSACIREPNCIWCSDQSWNGTGSRCSLTKQKACGEAFTVNPINNVTYSLNEALVSYKSNVSEVSETAPQEIHLNMRMNKPINITLKYARAEYPVDLYYLMDLSYSMNDDKKTLASLGKDLEQAMRNYTSDFKLGFGSFVDKVVGPFTNTLPWKLKQPCEKCTASPYGFRNHMQLSKNVTNFPLEVSRANISGNTDKPEGGFDGLMQAVVCRDIIGWRKDARRLLIFSTDSGFHMAGDGKLGGIVEPNDGKCHLDESGMYTHSLLQDYPSVSQLRQKVSENAIIVIFAVVEHQLQNYKYLTEKIDGAQAGILTNDSSNILELLKEEYQKISSSVKMEENATDDIKVEFYTSCQQNSSEGMEKSNRCDGLKIGEEVEFQVEIKLIKCPTNREKWNQTFNILPYGSLKGTVIHLTMNCDCSCEHKNDMNYKEDAPECNNNGTYMCGICSCNEKHFGQKCECSSDHYDLKDSGIPSDCKYSNDKNTVDCSGRGICYCGVCKCDSERFYGKYCECDDNSCDLVDEQLCAGHGTCECGKCRCDAGWTGVDCNCLDNENNCISNSEERKCSGNGYCKCGACICSPGYEGHYCEQEIRSEAQTKECEKLQPCVLCLVHNKGPFNEEQCKDNCTSISIEEVDYIEDNVNSAIKCVQYYQGQCRFEYQYIYQDTSFTVKALRSLECPAGRIIMASVVGGIIGFIILGGLCILLIWKLIAMRKYRIEYEQFEKRIKNAQWDETTNPLYRQPVSEFRNPTYDAVLSD